MTQTTRRTRTILQCARCLDHEGTTPETMMIQCRGDPSLKNLCVEIDHLPRVPKTFSNTAHVLRAVYDLAMILGSSRPSSHHRPATSLPSPNTGVPGGRVFTVHCLDSRPRKTPERSSPADGPKSRNAVCATGSSLVKIAKSWHQGACY